MSTGMSVPRPRLPGLDVADSALLASLLAEAPVGFAFIGTDGQIRRMNQAMAWLLGRDDADAGEQAGLTDVRAWPPDLATAAESAVGRVAAGDRPEPQTEHVLAVPRADNAGGNGAVRYWSFSWFPSTDGDISGVGTIAVESTGQHVAAEALRRSEERYRSLVQAGAQVVWVTRPDGEIAEDSPEWRSITGQTAEEYLSKGWLDAIHSDDRERVEAAWRECVRSGKVFDSRYRVRSRTGSYRHYDVRAVPIERDGEIIEWMGASTDVTAQREAEEMRGRLTEQLSAAALRTARLQQATSMLAEALTVEQVVQVITEVGRSAIGAERSAVAILDTERLRLRTINPGGLPDSPGAPRDDMPLSVASVMTLAITTRRPVLMESPEALRRCFDAEGVDVSLFLEHSDEKAWVGLPLLSSGASLGALRFSFTRPRQITEE
jgi:PAS domain S-box-containing protein